MSIYVEILIRGDLDRVWETTQDPSQHARWDLRFHSIEYLPRNDCSQMQRFRYATRIGFGMEIAGEGVTVGSCTHGSGERTSVLRFWSEDGRSLIREGAGYWKYAPAPEGVRFFTSYDYRTRFGRLGKWFDQLVFRPLMGWATAWSFDSLRLWIERGIAPEVSRERSIVHWLARLTLASVWLYQGLVPKLIFRSPDELRLLSDSGVPSDWCLAVLAALGIAEVLLGFLLLVVRRAEWLLRATLFAMAVAITLVAVSSPQFFSAAFNPLSLNLLMGSLAVIGLLSGRDLPSARNCLRSPKCGAKPCR